MFSGFWFADQAEQVFSERIQGGANHNYAPQPMFDENLEYGMAQIQGNSNRGNYRGRGWGPTRAPQAEVEDLKSTFPQELVTIAGNMGILLENAQILLDLHKEVEQVKSLHNLQGSQMVEIECKIIASIVVK